MPLAFVLMTRRRAVDFVEVLGAVRGLMVNPEVQEMISDFEVGMWKAVKDIFPNFRHYDCQFHWAEAIMRKIKKQLTYLLSK